MAASEALFVKIFRNPKHKRANNLTISQLEIPKKKSGTLRLVKCRFSIRKVPLFDPKSGTLPAGSAQLS